MANKKYRIRLTIEEQQELKTLVSRGRTAAYKQTHARILLMSDESRQDGGMRDADISGALGIGVSIVERVRRRCVEEGSSRQPHTSAVTEPHLYEVVGPHVVLPLRPQAYTGAVIEPQPSSLWLLRWHLQPFPSLYPLDPLVVHIPATMPQKGGDPPVAVPAELTGQLHDLLGQRLLISLRACECFEVPLWLSVMLVMGVRPLGVDRVESQLREAGLRESIGYIPGRIPSRSPGLPLLCLLTPSTPNAEGCAPRRQGA